MEAEKKWNNTNGQEQHNDLNGGKERNDCTLIIVENLYKQIVGRIKYRGNGMNAMAD